MGKNTMLWCWQCGKKLTNPFGVPVVGEERTIRTGQTVRVHKICGESFDRDWKESHRTVNTNRAPMDEAKGNARISGEEDR